jgi:hypothetical protein
MTIRRALATLTPVDYNATFTSAGNVNGPDSLAFAKLGPAMAVCS